MPTDKQITVWCQWAIAVFAVFTVVMLLIEGMRPVDAFMWSAGMFCWGFTWLELMHRARERWLGVKLEEPEKSEGEQQ